MNDRLDFLDGMRGWGALTVFHFHLGSFFFRKGKWVWFDKFFYETPLQLIADGELAIYLFFVLSGFSLSYKFFKNEPERQYLAKAALFRYFRLFIPVFFAVLIPYFLITFNGMFNTIAFKGIYENAFSFSDMLKYVFIELPFQSHANHTIYGLVFWTLYLEFTASLGIFAFLALFGTKKLRFALYALLAIPLYQLPGHHGLYFLFFIGLVTCDLYCLYGRNAFVIASRAPQFRGFKVAGLRMKLTELRNLCLNDKFQSSTLLLFITFYYYSVIAGHTLIFKSGHYDTAILLLLLTLGSPFLQKFFSSKPSLFLGRISFSLYLIHLPILCSFTCFIFQSLRNLGLNLASTALISLCLTELLVLGLAYVFSLLIEERVLPWVKTFVQQRHLNNKKVSIDAPFLL